MIKYAHSIKVILRHCFFLYALIAMMIIQSCASKESQRFELQGNTVVIPFEKGSYKITAISDDIINVRYSDSITYSDRNYAPIVTEDKPFAINENENSIELKVENISVVININPFGISFINNDETKLTTKKSFERKNDTTILRFNLSESEALYGTGARALPLNRRGYKLVNYNKASYAYQMGAELLNYCIPHVTSSNKYMLLFDNPAKSYIDIGKTDPNTLEFGSLGGNMSYYFINGSSYEELITSYTTLTGRQEIPPIWSFGNLQSRFGYRNQKEAEDLLDASLSAGYPVDAMILDIYWFGPELQDGQMGKLTWDDSKWPDPTKMISSFQSKGVNTITVSEPFFTLKSGRFEALQSNGLLGKDSTGNAMQIPYFYFGNAGLLDIFSEDAKVWIWDEYKRLEKYGINGWWVDLGEPEVHPDSMIHVNGLGREVHGAYGHEWAKMLFEGHENDFPNQRMFHMGRAGFAGTQRYSLIPWSGDVSRTWSGLKAQLPIMLGVGMSGISYMHADAGGFSFVEAANPELYTRWLQFAAFTPIFRPHADEVVAPEPVTWPQSVQDNVKPSIKLRYQLLPYNYTLAWETMQTGMPMARAMFMEDESIPDTLYSQYMWGKNLLISPVLESNLTELKTYLPEGLWYDYHNNSSIEGASWVTSTLKPNQIPVFVKGGSVIAHSESVGNASSYTSEELTLKYYFSEAPATQTVYFDDGKSKDSFKNDAYQLLNVSSNKKNGVLTLDLNITGNGYEGAPESRLLNVQLVGINTPETVKVNGNNIDFQVNDGIASFGLTIKEKAQIVIN